MRPEELMNLGIKERRLGSYRENITREVNREKVNLLIENGSIPTSAEVGKGAIGMKAEKIAGHCRDFG